MRSSHFKGTDRLVIAALYIGVASSFNSANCFVSAVMRGGD